MNTRNSQSFHGPTYYRFRHIWTSIKDLIQKALQLPVIAVGFIAAWLYDKTNSEAIAVVTGIVGIIIAIPFFIAAAIIGAVGGLFRGIFHAISRSPISEDKIIEMQTKLQDYHFPQQKSFFARHFRNTEDAATINNNPAIERTKRFLNKLAARYEQEKSSYSSTASLNIIRSIKGEDLIDDDLITVGVSKEEPPTTSQLIREYLIAHAAENNGKRLFTIFSEVLGKDDAREANYRKNITLIAQGRRDTSCLFHTLPKYVLLMIAERTVDPGYVANNPELVATYATRLDKQAGSDLKL